MSRPSRVREVALTIQKSLGTRTAAGYLRNKGWSLEGARALLLLPRLKDIFKEVLTAYENPTKSKEIG